MQSQPQVQESAYRSFRGQSGDRLTALREEMEFLNTMGKRFVAAINRFQVHRALLATLQELYSFSACSILLKGTPPELSIIPRYPLSQAFLEAMFSRIARAAEALDFAHVTAEELSEMVYLDAPDDLSLMHAEDHSGATEIRDYLNIPLTVENRIIGILSLFDEHEAAFDTNLLQLTTMIADYAAIALENVRLRERERDLWREGELERRRLELIISSMAEGLLITDAEGTITSFNRSAQHLLTEANFDVRQTTLTSLRDLATSTQMHWLNELADSIDKALAGKTVINHEIIVGSSDETVPLTLSISAAPLYDAYRTQNHPLGMVAVLNDVTSNKHVEKLKDEFVSVVSHELRTPLTAIKGYTQHLARRLEKRMREASQFQEKTGSPSVEPPENYDLRSLRIVEGQTEHLERLVNDLLDLSRVQWGELHLEHKTFYLADLLAEAVRSMQASVELHILHLDIQVQDSKITADQVRIGQVVGNILDNAVKFSPHGGQVTIKLQEQNDEYLVSIIDQGIGVSPEYFDHIFERFYRVRNAVSRQYSGIGLGLYVAKAIVEAHRGRIWLSNNQGKGSTFYFTLPRNP